MKKIEIKEFGIKNAFKITIYIFSIPLVIMAFIGLIITIIGAFIGNSPMLFMGLPYVIMPFFMLGIYGLLSMLTALVYNKLAGKFGGIELVISEKIENE